MAKPAPIWTRAYTLLVSSVFLSYAHSAMLFVVIPLYVDHLGHSAFVAGLALLAFSLPSFSLRPFIGAWADSWSAVGVLILGALVVGLSGLGYLIPSFVAVFVFSATRGLGWAGLNTGGYTLVAQMTPPTRRAEASGYYTSISGAATLAFPAIALWLVGARYGGYPLVFAVAAALALASSAIGFFGLRPSLPSSIVGQMRRPGTSFLAGGALLDRGVLLATFIAVTVTLTSPALTAFLPLYARQAGIHGVGSFFIVMGIADLAVRPTLGRASDRLPRGYSIVPAFAAQLGAVALIVFWGSLPAILLGGILYAAGSAVNGSSTMALAMDLADPRRRGTAMATYSLSYQMGVGIGSVVAGALVTTVGFRGMYLGAMAMLCCGLLLALTSWHRIGQVIPAHELA